MSERKIILTGKEPVVGQTTFVVCKNGHVNEAPNHPGAAFRAENGEVVQAVFCARCMFEVNSAMYGGKMLPRETTRREAEWAAAAMQKGALRQAGLQCCDLPAMHLGDCEEKTASEEKSS